MISNCALEGSAVQCPSIQEALGLTGFALLREFAPKLEPAAAFRLLGRVESLEGFAEVQYLTPKERDASTPNTYSGNFGTCDFPLHTDLAHWGVPPRYLALRCVEGNVGVATRLLDGNLVCNIVGRSRLRMALVQPRRRLADGKHLLRLLEKVQTNAGERVRWDPLFLRAANGRAASVLDEFRDALRANVPADVVLENPGDTMVIDNYRMLHGRSSVPPNSMRVIARAYLESVNL